MDKFEGLDENWRLQIVKLLEGMTKEQAEFVDWVMNQTFDSMLRNMGEFEDE